MSVKPFDAVIAIEDAEAATEPAPGFPGWQPSSLAEARDALAETPQPIGVPRGSGVYVATAYAAIDVAIATGRMLRSRGIPVVSRWHDLPKQDETELDDDTKAALFCDNVDDLIACRTVLVLDLPGARTTFAELGIAFVLGKRIVYIAEASKHCLAGWAEGVERETWESTDDPTGAKLTALIERDV